MGIWSKVFGGTYDRFMAKSEREGLAANREKLLTAASGDVLEIGGGTGANITKYAPTAHSLPITEPEKPMIRRLQRRIDEQRPGARALRAPAEDLPFEDDTFDTPVSTLVRT